MIARLILFTALTIAMVLAGVWLADHPGQVTLHWLGWRVDSSVAMLLVLNGLFLAALLLVWRGLSSLLNSPATLRRWWLGRKQQRGLGALADGLNAAALGDGRKARRLARQASALLPDRRLTGLLSVQAAQLGGTVPQQEKALHAIADHPDTAAAGLKGLVDLYQTQGDTEKALSCAQRAWDLPVTIPGLAVSYVDLLLDRQAWDDADSVLTSAIRRKAIDPSQVAQRQAIIWTHQALDADRNGQAERAFDLARRATRANPSLPLAATLLARLLHRRNKHRKAQAVLAECWRHHPDPSLVTAWFQLAPAETPLQRVERLSRLIRGNPHAALSHQSLGDAALAAKLWGQARTHLLRAADILPSDAVFESLARLERDEHHDEDAAQRWLHRRTTSHDPKAQTPQLPS